MERKDAYGEAFQKLSVMCSELKNEVRMGWSGLKEFFSTNFFFVRDVYMNRVLPYINESQSPTSSFTTSASFQKIFFEKPVDGILITPTEDILLAYSAGGSDAFLLKGNSTHNLNIRRKELYIARSSANGTCYIWGLF